MDAGSAKSRAVRQRKPSRKLQESRQHHGQVTSHPSYTANPALRLASGSFDLPRVRVESRWPKVRCKEGANQTGNNRSVLQTDCASQ